MRTKPLNPNSMAVIMENFRRFADDVEMDEGLINEEVIYLFERDSAAPTSQKTFGSLLKEYKEGVINEESLFEQWEASTTYEYNLLIEGRVLDALKKPMEAFANSKIAIAAKKKARQAISMIGAKLFVGIAKILKALIEKAKGLEQKLISTAGSAQDGKVKMNAVIKLHQAATALVMTGIKKLKNAAVSIIGRVLGVFNHPLVKAAIVIICAGILILSVINSAIFVGCLAAAPMFAMRKLGTKGAKAFWDQIPNTAGAVAESLQEAILAGKLGGKFLLKEVADMMDIAAQAIADLAADIPVGTTEEFDLVNLSSQVSDADAGTFRAEDYTWIQYADGELTRDLSAIESLQWAMEGRGMMDMVDLESLMQTSKAADDLWLRTIQTALKVAEETCTEDPEMCAASRLMAQEFETFNISDISSELTNSAVQITQNDEVQEAWEVTTSSLESHSAETVTQNPFADPDAAARGAGEAEEYSQSTTYRGGLSKRKAAKIARKGAELQQDLARVRESRK